MYAIAFLLRWMSSRLSPKSRRECPALPVYVIPLDLSGIGVFAVEHNTKALITIRIFLAGWSRLIAARISKILFTREHFFTKRPDQSLHSARDDIFTVNSDKEMRSIVSCLVCRI